MEIKQVDIKGYKCFDNETINLNVSDGGSGSGLNVLVGQNNSGKTAFLNTFGKLRSESSIYSLERRDGSDVTIVFTDLEGKRMIVKNLPKSSSLVLNGDSPLSYSHIDSVKDNKFWSGGVHTSSGYEYDVYKSTESENRNEVDENLATALLSISTDPERKEKYNKVMKSIFPGFRDWFIDANDPVSGLYVKYMVSDSDEGVRIEFALGSGILSAMKIVYSIVEGNDAILILDEPEAFLHPSAQGRLLKQLVKESKNRQIILSTHSPYMYKGLSSNASILRFENNKKTGITHTAQIRGFVLPSGPTYGEINYFVYKMPTEEIHNELYGYLDYIYINYVQGSARYNFDGYLSGINSKEAVKREMWKDDRYQCRQKPCTLQTFIRHQIHHPENTCSNRKYSQTDLRRSISEMLRLVRSEKKIHGIR